MSKTKNLIIRKKTKLEDYAFQDDEDIEEVTFESPCQIKEIPDGCFSGCTSLKRVSIPKSVKRIGDEAFEGCEELERVDAPYGIDIEPSAFEGCLNMDLNEIDYYSGEDSVIPGSFPPESEHVSIPEGTKHIIAYAFSKFKKMTSIEIPDSIETIGVGAFEDCTSLTEIVLPDSIQSLDDSVFAGCVNLKHVTLPKGLAIISRLFKGCTALEHINLPDTITEIGSQSFAGCDHLTTIILPKHLGSIYTDAFYGCSRLTEIVSTSDKYLNIVGINKPLLTISKTRRLPITRHIPKEVEVKLNSGMGMVGKLMEMDPLSHLVINIGGKDIRINIQDICELRDTVK